MTSQNNLNMLILHAHWNNRGDEAAIRAMIDSLRSKLLIDNMEIMMMTDKVFQFPYDNINQIEMYPSNLTECADSLLALLTLGNLCFIKKGKKFLKAINNSDVIIHAPGGPSIGDMYGGKIVDYPYLFRLLIATIKKKPIFFYAPSMGPFSNKFFNTFRKIILKKAKVLAVREGISAKYLKEQLGLDSSVTVDSAFQNEIPMAYIQKYPEVVELLNTVQSKNVIGLTITDLKWHPIYRNYNGLSESIIESISETIMNLTNRGYTILLIPQLFGNQNDINLLEKFKKIDPCNILVLPENIDSYAQQIIISRLYCVIGMRYHSNIFAAKGNVPFISIYYEHKMKGFMDKIELADLAINVENISAKAIENKFMYLEQNYSLIKRRLEIETPKLKAKSKKTTELIMDNLKKWSPSKIKKNGE